MGRTIRSTVALVALLGAGAASGGTVIETQSSDDGDSRMMVSGQQLRMESDGRFMLFNAATEEMRFVDPASKSYTVMTREDVEQVAQRIEQMRQQMEKQLQNVPEDQRAAMRKQMQSMMPGTAERPEIRVEATGGSDQVAGASCELAKVYRGGQAAQEVCVADPEAVGIPASDFESIMGMFDFFDEIAGAMGGSDSKMGAREMRTMMEQLGGMPVRARGLQDSGSNWEIVGVRQESIADDRFTVPSGYQQRKRMGGQ